MAKVPRFYDMFLPPKQPEMDPRYFAVRPEDEQMFIAFIERLFDEYVDFNGHETDEFALTKTRLKDRLLIRFVNHCREQAHADIEESSEAHIEVVASFGTANSENHDSFTFSPNDERGHSVILDSFGLRKSDAPLRLSFAEAVKLDLLVDGDRIVYPLANTSRQVTARVSVSDEKACIRVEGSKEEYCSMVAFLASIQGRCPGFRHLELFPHGSAESTSWYDLRDGFLAGVLQTRSLKAFYGLTLHALGCPEATVVHFLRWADLRNHFWPEDEGWALTYAMFVAEQLYDGSREEPTHVTLFEASRLEPYLWEPCLHFPSLLHSYSPIGFLECLLVMVAGQRPNRRSPRNINLNMTHVTVNGKTVPLLRLPAEFSVWEKNLLVALQDVVTKMGNSKYNYYHVMNASQFDLLLQSNLGLQMRLPPSGGQDFGFAPSYYVSPDLDYVIDRGLGTAIGSQSTLRCIFVLIFALETRLEDVQHAEDLSGPGNLSRWKHVVTTSRNTETGYQSSRGGPDEDVIGNVPCVFGNWSRGGRSPVSLDHNIHVVRSFDENQELVPFHWVKDTTQIAIRSEALMEFLRQGLDRVLCIELPGDLGLAEARKQFNERLSKEMRHAAKYCFVPFQFHLSRYLLSVIGLSSIGHNPPELSRSSSFGM